MNYATRRPLLSSRKEDDAVAVLTTDENDEFLMEPKDVRPSYVEVRRMIESALQIFEETTLERRNDTMMEIKVASLFEIATQEATKLGKIIDYLDVEKMARGADSEGAVKKVI